MCEGSSVSKNEASQMKRSAPRATAASSSLQRASPGEVVRDDEVRDTAEVVAVEVRHRDRVDRRGVEVLLDRREGGPAAVEQQRDAWRGDEDGGIGAATVAERVPATEEADRRRAQAISYRPTGRCSSSDVRAASARRSASMPSTTVQTFSASPRAKRRKCAS